MAGSSGADSAEIRRPRRDPDDGLAREPRPIELNRYARRTTAAAGIPGITEPHYLGLRRTGQDAVDGQRTN